MKKYLALDMGEKRIGLAVSDGLGMLAHPLKTLQWEGIDKFVDQLNVVVVEEQISAIVIGIPYTLKGTDSKKTTEIKQLAGQLRERLDMDIIEIDERLTTKMAENILQAVGKKASKYRDKIDQIAAVQILQTYLDKIN